MIGPTPELIPLAINRLQVIDETLIGIDVVNAQVYRWENGWTLVHDLKDTVGYLYTITPYGSAWIVVGQSGKVIIDGDKITPWKFDADVYDIHIVGKTLIASGRDGSFQGTMKKMVDTMYDNDYRMGPIVEWNGTPLVPSRDGIVEVSVDVYEFDDSPTSSLHVVGQQLYRCHTHLWRYENESWHRIRPAGF